MILAMLWRNENYTRKRKFQNNNSNRNTNDNNNNRIHISTICTDMPRKNLLMKRRNKKKETKTRYEVDIVL